MLSAMTTLFGSASPCKRAARFGVSPTMPRSCEAPASDQIADHYQPSRNADARLKGRMGLQSTHRRDQCQTRAHSPLGVVLMRLRIAEIDKHAVAQILWLRTRRSGAQSRQRTSDRPK